MLAPNALIAMNQPSLDKFERSVTEAASWWPTPRSSRTSGRAGRERVRHPRHAMAEEAGFKLASIIMADDCSPRRASAPDTLWKAMEKCVPASKAAMLEMNRRPSRWAWKRDIPPARPAMLMRLPWCRSPFFACPHVRSTLGRETGRDRAPREASLTDMDL
ncbi:MAG: hypothetical protein ACLVKI_06170 [Gordonibacter urolithinfaciens]